MNRLVLIMSMGVVGMCIYLAFGQFQQARAAQAQGLVLEQNIRVLKSTAEDLEELEDGPALAVDVCYRQVYESLRILSEFYNVKSLVEDPSLTATPSGWKGIRQIPLKINFYDMAGADQHMKVLKSLEHLGKQYTLEIISIEHNGKDLSVAMELYGT